MPPPTAAALYERLGFVASGELRQHQGIAVQGPLVALPPGWRLRPPGQSEAAALQALDADARGMPRDALIAALLGSADATVVLDHEGRARGFAHAAPLRSRPCDRTGCRADADGAKALIAHLAGLNAGRFTRIDIDVASDLGGWLESLGLAQVDAPTKWCAAPSAAAAADSRRYAIATQALG